MPRPRLERPNFRLRQRGRSWVIDWTDPRTGKSQSVSTRTRDYATAERQRDELAAGWGRPFPPAAPTIAEILDGYLADRRGHVRDHQRLVDAGKAIKTHVGNLRPEHLGRRLYWQRRRADGRGDGTILKEVVTLRAALRWAVKEQWIPAAPAIEAPPKPSPRERFLSRAEADALLAACQTPHLRLYVLLALHTAARTGAILDLEWRQVDFAARRISFRKPGRTETQKRRATVPINRTLLSALQAAALTRTTDHVIEYRGRRIAKIRKAFERAVARAGIAYCTRHDLRRTAASWMVMAGVPLKKVAAMLGDTEAMVETVYGKWAPDYLAEAAHALEGDVSPTDVGFMRNEARTTATKRGARAREKGQKR
jgi:integrase